MDTLIIKRIINWNSNRYEQEYNHHLTCNLLLEEVNELTVARNPVDKIDALVDIIYVATGALWKLGLNEEQIYRAIEIVCDSNDSKKVEKVDSSIKANIDKGDSYVSPTERLTLLWKEVSNE